MTEEAPRDPQYALRLLDQLIGELKGAAMARNNVGPQSVAERLRPVAEVLEGLVRDD